MFIVLATQDLQFFDGFDYAYWRNKMKMFLDSEWVNLWDIIEEGWSAPIKKDNEGNEVTIPRKQ